MLQLKNLTIGGRTLKIAGPETDQYFQGLENVAADNIPLFELIWTRLQPGSVIFDIGANIGVTSALFNTVVKESTVYSFEPGHMAFPCLLQTLKANQIDTSRSFNVALSDMEGEANFSDNEGMLAGGHLQMSQHSLPTSTAKVQVTTLDKFVETHHIDRIDFIKMDVEGFELNVLNGAKATLACFRPTVFLEFNSYSLISARDTNPRDALKQIRAIFPHVAAYDAGKWRPILTAKDAHEFIYRNLVLHACVDDLLCKF